MHAYIVVELTTRGSYRATGHHDLEAAQKYAADRRRQAGIYDVAVLPVHSAAH